MVALLKATFVLGVVLMALLGTLVILGHLGGDATSQVDALKTPAELVAEALNRTDERIVCEAKANAPCQARRAAL